VSAINTLLDKQALHELVLRYCRAVDRRDYVALRALYHDDAIDHHGDMFTGSPDEYVAWLPSVLAGFECTAHSISNALFVISGDVAEGEIYTEAYHRTPAPSPREIVIGGRFLDQYQRRDGVWRFFRRSLALDWCRAGAVDMTSYQQFAAAAPPGRTDDQDPSYRALPLFKTFKG